MSPIERIELPAIGTKQRGSSSGCTHREEGDTRIVIMYYGSHNAKGRYLDITTKYFEMCVYDEEYVIRYLESKDQIKFVEKLVHKKAANTPGVYDELVEATHRRGVIDGRNIAAAALRHLMQYH